MEFKQDGYFKWDATGFASIDAAKTEIFAVLQRIPAFLLDDGVKQEIRIDTKTGEISAHVSTDTYEGTW